MKSGLTMLSICLCRSLTSPEVCFGRVISGSAQFDLGLAVETKPENVGFGTCTLFLAPPVIKGTSRVALRLSTSLRNNGTLLPALDRLQYGRGLGRHRRAE